MELDTIGAFARAARLSPKALRLYDELGLLRPARVDPGSGYRLYHPAQLDRARLIAWLRELGMPLARIRAICDAEPADAARAVAAYWDQVLADTEAKRRIAAFLIDHLSGKDSLMSDESTTMSVRHAVGTDRGRVRESNQDVAYADDTLLVVADGFGPHDADPLASAVAVDALTGFDGLAGLEPAGAEDGLTAVLADAFGRAAAAVGELAGADCSGAEAGTTLTAILRSGSRLVIGHIGDTRAYLLRDGELAQLTDDHNVARVLLDQGELTAEEVATHPRRFVLLRALHSGTRDKPELAARVARPGDRYLLTSDGLHTVLPVDRIREVLEAEPEPDAVVAALIDEANAAGGPDNIACVVADLT